MEQLLLTLDGNVTQVNHSIERIGEIFSYSNNESVYIFSAPTSRIIKVVIATV